MGESITEGTLTQWHKKIGDVVKRDEQVATIETDKIDVQVNSPEPGKITSLFVKEGDTVAVGGNLLEVEVGDFPSAPAPMASAPAPMASAPVAPAPVVAPVAPVAAPPPAPVMPVTPDVQVQQKKASVAQESTGKTLVGDRGETRVKMTRMRARIAERLKESQNSAASLTTFNEVDMSALLGLRSKYKEAILEKHGIKFGFMSPFIKAVSVALSEIPAVNARIDGDTIVYQDFKDISVAVATPKGLVTPVLRNTEKMSMIDIEKELARMSKKARDGQLAIEDMAGGTFTISNGGVFGSLLGTPIINQPQAAILGMHATKERPVVVDGKIEIRPMMYLALTYDHRLIDGREAVTFLVKVKEIIEDPARLLLDI